MNVWDLGAFWDKPQPPTLVDTDRFDQRFRQSRREVCSAAQQPQEQEGEEAKIINNVSHFYPFDSSHPTEGEWVSSCEGSPPYQR